MCVFRISEYVCAKIIGLSFVVKIKHLIQFLCTEKIIQIRLRFGTASETSKIFLNENTALDFRFVTI